MNITELIERLEAIRAEHGDLSVLMKDSTGYEVNIDLLEVNEQETRRPKYSSPLPKRVTLI